jgi:hypothetical protein
VVPPSRTAGATDRYGGISHVKRILMKLNLRDRVQAVIFAYETGVNRPVEGAKPTPPQDRATSE